jgi:prepilin-type N-terminal cleavage/methylation domain-containing protein
MSARGFTLVELMVALVITTFVLLIGGGALAAVIDGNRRLHALRVKLDEAQNGRHTFVSMLRSAEAGEPAPGPFAGDSVGFTCAVWQEVAGGWSERRRLVVALRDDRLLATTPGQDLVLARDVSGLRITYLGGFDRSMSWTTAWSSPISVPAAIRIVVRQGSPKHLESITVIVGTRG